MTGNATVLNSHAFERGEHIGFGALGDDRLFVALKVVRKAPCPVLTVRASEVT